MPDIFHKPTYLSQDALEEGSFHVHCDGDIIGRIIVKRGRIIQALAGKEQKMYIRKGWAIRFLKKKYVERKQSNLS